MGCDLCILGEMERCQCNKGGGKIKSSITKLLIKKANSKLYCSSEKYVRNEKCKKANLTSKVKKIQYCHMHSNLEKQKCMNSHETKRVGIKKLVQVCVTFHNALVLVIQTIIVEMDNFKREKIIKNAQRFSRKRGKKVNAKVLAKKLRNSHTAPEIGTLHAKGLMIKDLYDTDFNKRKCNNLRQEKPETVDEDSISLEFSKQDKCIDFLHTERCKISESKLNLALNDTFSSLGLEENLFSKTDSIKNKELETNGEADYSEAELSNLCNILSNQGFNVKPAVWTVYTLDTVMPPNLSMIGSIPWAWLREEKWRLHTFAKYPQNTAKSAILLAQAGFAYIGSGKGSDDSVICFFCRGSKRGWREDEYIEETHRNLSQACPMLTGVECGNVPFLAPTNASFFLSNSQPVLHPNSAMSHGQDVIETDSVPNDFPASGRPSRPAALAHQTPGTSVPASARHRRPVQMATSTVMSPAQERPAVLAMAPGEVVVDTVTPNHPTDEAGPSNMVTSNNIASAFPTEGAALSKPVATAAVCRGGQQHSSQGLTPPSLTGSQAQQPTSLTTPASPIGARTVSDSAQSAPGSRSPSASAANPWSNPPNTMTQSSTSTANLSSAQPVAASLSPTQPISTNQSSSQPASANQSSQPTSANQSSAQSSSTNQPSAQPTLANQSSQSAPANQSSQRAPANQSSAQSASTNQSSAQSASANQPSAQSASANQPSAQSASANQSSAQSASANQSSAQSASANQSSAQSALANQSSAQPAMPQNPTYLELGIITERPKRYEYAVCYKRLETFGDWPADHHLRKEDLADAGFYYAGYGDCARCFYCGGGLRNWEQEDDVWVEHAHWFPKCAFVRQRVGQVFIDTVAALGRDHEKISFQMVVEKMNIDPSAFQIDSKESRLKNDPAVRVVRNMGYRDADILPAAAMLKETTQILSADTLYTALEAQGVPRPLSENQSAVETASVDMKKDQETLNAQKKTNSELRLLSLCKVCMDKEAAVVFLPCGHLVCCTECASAMKDCPFCRKQVKGMVRAFMG